MKKPKTKEALIAEAKRGKKRSDRLKQTQAKKGVKKLSKALTKKYQAMKYIETINKVLQERNERNKIA